MRMLHTSDWHLGHRLHGQKRYREQQAFLDWLAELIAAEGIQVLVLAGDVFDSSAPGNRAQELYYRFLWRAAGLGCRHMVITGGNHDSPSLLDAPRDLLKRMNIHVIGAALEDPADEILVLDDWAGQAAMIVCAVPYLRDRDLRVAEAGESIEDKERKLLKGIREHYREVCGRAEALREEILSREDAPVLPASSAGLGSSGSQAAEGSGPRGLPIVATGHLFAAGARAGDDEGIRELYIGSLARVDAGSFPACIDYLALGHLHSPQLLGAAPGMRYSGAPLAMNFGERGGKSVCIVDFIGCHPEVRLVEVPRFQALERIEGDMPELREAIVGLRAAGSNAWLEAIYTGQEYAPNLREMLDEATAGSGLEILAVKNRRQLQRLQLEGGTEQLEDLDPEEVFRRCLEQHKVPAEQRPGLLEAYREVLASVYEEDPGAE